MSDASNTSRVNRLPSGQGGCYTIRYLILLPSVKCRCCNFCQPTKYTQDSSKRADPGSGRTFELQDGGREAGACNSELWDPTRDTGVFVKVHCISTEFTPKKHGGERGVPFRLQVNYLCVSHLVKNLVKNPFFHPVKYLIF